MAEYDGKTDCTKQLERQPVHKRENDHGQADYPDHLQIQHRRRDLSGPGKIDNYQLEEDKQHPALDQETGSRARAGRGMRVQPGRKPGQEHEHRGTEVGCQAREEQLGRSGRHVHRVADLHMQVDRLAYVVEQHDEHDQAAHHVNNRNARTHRLLGQWQCGAGGGKHDGVSSAGMVQSKLSAS